MASFNYRLLCCSHRCQEGKKKKFDEYNDGGNRLLTATEKKRIFAFMRKMYFQFEKL